MRNIGVSRYASCKTEMLMLLHALRTHSKYATN